MWSMAGTFAQVDSASQSKMLLDADAVAIEVQYKLEEAERWRSSRWIPRRSVLVGRTQARGCRRTAEERRDGNDEWI